jgi:hypothetical protein
VAASFADDEDPHKIPRPAVESPKSRSSVGLKGPTVGSERNTMSEYLILIYDNEAEWMKAAPSVSDDVMKGHTAFGEANGSALRGGNALQPTGTATSIRANGSGDFVVTDGAFAETKEALAGYYLIEAANLDDALAIAKQVPAPFGGIEVRPVRVFD